MKGNGHKLEWRDRVVGFERRPAKDFQAHPLNFRRHPNAQRDAFRGVLAEIGFAGAVLENVRSGHLLDGHLRIEEALSINDEQLIPCIQVDLSENEEKLLLSTYDPISAMAATDKEALERLLKDVSVSNGAVDALLKDLAEKNGLNPANLTVPNANNWQDPTLKSESVVEIYCSKKFLDSIRGTLNEWSSNATVNIQE